jgi:hypothetical protein
LTSNPVATSSMSCVGTSLIYPSDMSLLAPLASHRPRPTPNNSRKRKRQKVTLSNDQHPFFVNPPPLISSITIGFNSTTEHLESEIQAKSSKCMRAVFVARGDTSSTHLYAHFPLMGSMLPHLRLVSLAKGAEGRLCETLQLRRVGVLGLMVILFCSGSHCRTTLLVQRHYFNWLKRRSPRLNFHGSEMERRLLSPRESSGLSH